MYKYLIRGRKKQSNFYKNERRLLMFKYVLTSWRSSMELKYWFYLKFLKSNPFFYTFTKIKNFCVFTGRSRSVKRFTNLSRLQFHKLAHHGEFAGISKSTW